MVKSYLSKMPFFTLPVLLVMVLVSGCASIGQKQPLLSGQVIDGDSGFPLPDVHIAISYNAAQGTQACYAIAVVKTDAQGYFDVPSPVTPDGVPAIEVQLYKRGYIFIAYDQGSVIWPVGINRTSIDVSADVIRQDQSLAAIKMYKNNMKPQHRLEYVGELADSNFDCTDVGQIRGYLAIVQAEVTDLEALGLTRDVSRVSDWYGPGIEGLQREAAALALLQKSRSKAPAVKLRSKKRTLSLTPRQIADKRGRERRRIERRKKLDEIRLKSQ